MKRIVVALLLLVSSDVAQASSPSSRPPSPTCSAALARRARHVARAGHAVPDAHRDVRRTAATP